MNLGTLKGQLANSAKRRIAGTPVGDFAHSLRSLWFRVTSDTDRLGWYCNDEIAEFLVGRLCQSDKVFVDGGAHLGSITSAVMRNCPRARLVTVEAIPEKADRLRRRFPAAQIENCALAETAGTVSFFIAAENSAKSSLANIDEPSKRIDVESRRLDDLDYPGEIDVIKLDLEGAELGALRGGSEIIGSHRPTVMFESGPHDFLGYTKDQMFTWFEERDYRIFLPARLINASSPMSREMFHDYHEFPFGTLNYFAVASERVDEVTRRAGDVVAKSRTGRKWISRFR